MKWWFYHCFDLMVGPKTMFKEFNNSKFNKVLPYFDPELGPKIMFKEFNDSKFNKVLPCLELGLGPFII